MLKADSRSPELYSEKKMRDQLKGKVLSCSENVLAEGKIKNRKFVYMSNNFLLYSKW